MGFEQTWPQTVLWNEHKRYVDKAAELVEAGDREKSEKAIDVSLELLDAWELLLKADPRYVGGEE